MMWWSRGLDEPVAAFDTRPLKGRLGWTGVLKDARLAEPRLQPTGNETLERHDPPAGRQLQLSDPVRSVP
jgi:hypothetical protein